MLGHICRGIVATAFRCAVTGEVLGASGDRVGRPAQDSDLWRHEMLLERGCKTDAGALLALEQGKEQLQGAARRVEVARVARQVTEPLEGVRRDTISGGGGAVVSLLGAVDQRFVVVGDEKETARLPVFKLIEEDVCKLARQRQILRDNFGKFVPEAIADQILAEEGALAPVTRTATVLFTDIEVQLVRWVNCSAIATEAEKNSDVCR